MDEKRKEFSRKSQLDSVNKGKFAKLSVHEKKIELMKRIEEKKRNQRKQE